MKKFFYFLTILLGAFPILKLNHFSIVMILWFVVLLYFFIKTKSYKQINFTTDFISVIVASILFWVYLLCFPFVNDSKEMMKIIVKSLPIFVFTFGFYMCKGFLPQYIIKWLFNVFIASTVLINFFGWIQIFRNNIVEVFSNNDFYHPTIRLIFAESSDIHIPYLGLLSAFSALLILYKIVYFGFNKLFGGLLIFLLLISMYVYSARMALGIFSVGLLFISFYAIKSKIIKYVFLLSIPILAFLTFNFSPIKERYVQSLQTDWVLPHEGQQPHEVNYRYGIGYCSFEILNKHTWFGVGPTNVQNELNLCYNQFTYKSYEDFSQKTYNSHNQYVDFLLKFGVIFGGLLIVSLFYFVLKSNLLYQVFIITIFLSFLTENILDRQMGVVYYSLFNAIFVVYKKGTFEKSISC